MPAAIQPPSWHCECDGHRLLLLLQALLPPLLFPRLATAAMHTALPLADTDSPRACIRYLPI